MNKKIIPFILLLATSINVAPKMESYAEIYDTLGNSSIINEIVENSEASNEANENSSIAPPVIENIERTNEISEITDTNTTISESSEIRDEAIENTESTNEASENSNTINTVVENSERTNETVENIVSEEIEIEAAAVTGNETKIITLNATNSQDIPTLNGNVQSALNNNNIKTVIVTSDDTIDVGVNTGFTFNIPEEKTLIWKAKIKANFSGAGSQPILLTLSGDGSFHFTEEGKLEYASNPVLALSGNIKATIQGGYIQAPGQAVSINLGKNGSFIMENGKIFSIYASKDAVVNNTAISIASTNQGTIHINGGLILGYNKEPLSSELARNKILTIGVINKEKNSDNLTISENAKIVAFDHHGNDLKKYFLKDSSASLKIYPDSSKVKWGMGKNGEGKILVDDEEIFIPPTEQNVYAYTINLPNNNIKYAERNITPPTLPANLPAEEGREFIVYYNDSTEIPTLPGKYDVSVEIKHTKKIGGTEVNQEVLPTDKTLIGSFEIQKRNITITPENVTIKVNEPLPQFMATVEKDMADGETFENSNYRLFVDTDGKAPGVFDIKMETIANGSYTPEGYEIYLAPRTLTVLADNSSPNPQVPQTPTPPNQNHHSGGSSNSGGSSGGGSGRRSGGGSGGGSAHTKKTDSKSNEVKGTWISDSKGWQFKHENGTLAKDIWQEISFNNKKDWYFFKNDGYMNTGWLLWNGNWYFLNEASDNNMVKGSMATGWKLISGKWYYFYDKSEGNTIKGSMAKSTTIDGYKVDENGAWIK